MGEVIKKSQIRSDLDFAGQKVRETGRIPGLCIRPSPDRILKAMDPKCQSQGEPRGKLRVRGEKRRSHQHRYLHETSTPGHQDPLREAAGRTKALLPARSRHLQLSSASAVKRGVRRTEVSSFTTLYDTPRPPTRSKEVAEASGFSPDHSRRGGASNGTAQAQALLCLLLGLIRVTGN